MNLILNFSASIITLYTIIPVVAAPKIPLLTASKRDSATLSQGMSQQMGNLVSSHTAAVGKDNLLKAGIKDDEFLNWKNAVKVITQDTRFADDFDNSLTQFKANLDFLHGKLKPYFAEGDHIKDIELILASIRRKTEEYIKNLDKLDLPKDSDLAKLREYQKTAFEKMRKEIDQIIIKSGSVKTDLCNLDISYTKKGLSNVEKSKLADRIASVKDKDVREKLQAGFDAIQALISQLRGEFSPWLQSDCIMVPDADAIDGEKKVRMLSGYTNMVGAQIDNLNKLKTQVKKEDASLLCIDFIKINEAIRTDIEYIMVALNRAAHATASASSSTAR